MEGKEGFQEGWRKEGGVMQVEEDWRKNGSLELEGNIMWKRKEIWLEGWRRKGRDLCGEGRVTGEGREVHKKEILIQERKTYNFLLIFCYRGCPCLTGVQ